MYLTHVINEAGQPVFILVLPFEQKQVAREAGFTWNSPQPGAWATADLAPVKNLFISQQVFSVAPETLDHIKAHTSMTDATYEKYKAAYTEPTRKEWAGIHAATLTDEQVRCVHEGLQYLAAVCDGAMADDRAGFNRNDIEFGHSLAAASQLSRTQAGHGKNILKKYRGQLGEELYACIFPELVEADRAAEHAKEQKKLARGAAKKHKNGEPCGVDGCIDSICMTSRNRVADEAARILADTQDEAAQASPEVLEAAQARIKPTLSEQITTMMGGNLAKFEPKLVSVHQLNPDGSKTDITDQPDKWYPEPPAELAQPVEAATGDDAEIARLCKSLIDCHPGDFDTTVDLLRALRGIDAPKNAGSDFTKAAWAAAGYKTK